MKVNSIKQRAHKSCQLNLLSISGKKIIFLDKRKASQSNLSELQRSMGNYWLY